MKDERQTTYEPIGRVCVLVVLLLVAVFMPGRVSGQAAGDTLGWYEVSEFVFQYRYNGRASLPSLDEIRAIEVQLFEQADGYSGSEGERVLLTVGSLSLDTKKSYHFTAIKSIQDQIVKFFNGQGIGGVVIMPAAGQIDMDTMQDLRADAGQKLVPLIIEIWVARVTSVEVKATNQPESKPGTESESLTRIKKYSPIIAAEVEPNAITGGTCLLKTDELEDYLYRLNRHPGRRVDVVIGPGAASGDVELDYNVRHGKPWLAYAQFSNTGSKDTSDFRQRYGVVNNQLTGNDDIFNLDYLTTDFDAVNSLAVSYDRPWFDSRDVRMRVWGSWSDYLSSEIGSGGHFSGGEKTVGLELRDNIYQQKRLFIDRFAGMRVSTYDIDNYINESEEISASETMVVPRLGYRLESDSGISRSFGELMLEFNLSSNDEGSMQNFGRLAAESNWYKLGWNLSHSFYLEPVFDPEGWRDITTPKSSTIAHELAFSTSGQWTDVRLIPQEKNSVGGLYSVRGYRQGFVSGDTVVQGSGEYRYHIPRGFDLSKPVTLPVFGNKFRWAPEQVYGLPDWDLIFRVFLDGALVLNNEERFNEDDYSLLSTGVGLEMQFSRYFSIRCDLGIPLLNETNSNGDKIEQGEPQVHLSGMVAY